MTVKGTVKGFMEDWDGEMVLADVRNFENEQDFLVKATKYLEDTRDNKVTLLQQVKTMEIVINNGEWQPYDGEKITVYASEIEEEG